MAPERSIAALPYFAPAPPSEERTVLQSRSKLCSFEFVSAKQESMKHGISKMRNFRYIAPIAPPRAPHANDVIIRPTFCSR